MDMAILLYAVCALAGVLVGAHYSPQIGKLLKLKQAPAEASLPEAVKTDIEDAGITLAKLMASHLSDREAAKTKLDDMETAVQKFLEAYKPKA